MRDFNHTVNVLVKAYLNGTLIHGHCDACAVGNIVRESYGKPIQMWRAFSWPTVFISNAPGRQLTNPGMYGGEAKEHIDSTGYTWQELARIEKAFESTDTGSEDDERIDRDMFNGLMAVVDVLAEIHGIDLTAKEQAKALFVKH